MAQSVRHARGGFIITKPIGLISPPLCFGVCLSFTCYYLFSLFGRTEWPRQSRPSRPIELWHNRCNTSMHLSQEPLIRLSCSFHQFAPAPVGFLGGMGVRQRGLLYCMWITLDATSSPPASPNTPSHSSALSVGSLSLKTSSPDYCAPCWPASCHSRLWGQTASNANLHQNVNN